MIYKRFLGFIILIGLLNAGCSDKKEVPTIKPPVIEPVQTDSLSRIIFNNSGLIKTIVSDSSYSNFAGLNETYIKFINKQDKPIALFILQIDLNNPMLSMEVGTPNNLPSANSVQRVSSMILAKNNSSLNTQVLAAINGDYFDTSTGIPLGPVHKNGVQIRTTMSSGYHFFGLINNNNYMIGDNSEYLNYQNRLIEVIGGRHLLLKNGEQISQTDISVNPRTAIGLIDFKKAIILVVDGRQADHSVGYTLTELARTLKALGAKNAVNMDGGGSSVFITKDRNNLYTKKNKVSDGSERSVANGLFVIQKM